MSSRERYLRQGGRVLWEEDMQIWEEDMQIMQQPEWNSLYSLLLPKHILDGNDGTLGDSKSCF